MGNAGRFEESITLMKKAMRLNPHYPAWYINVLANCYFMDERYEEAIEANKRVLERAQKKEYSPLFPLAGLSACYMELGRKEEAWAYAAELLKLYPKFSLDYLRQVNKNAAHYERFLEALRKAGLPEHAPSQ